MLNKLIAKIQGETTKYAKEALTNPVDKTVFEYGSHHGVLKGFGLVEQWIQELLEAEEDDESK